MQQGLVIRTEPAAGQQAKQGSPVNVVVSGGPDKVGVPVTAGQTQDAATAALEADPYGFKVTVKQQPSTTVASGIVIGTDPGANTSVAKGSDITLIVSSGPAKVAVPPVEGLAEAAARSQITGAGLQVSVSYVTVAVRLQRGRQRHPPDACRRHPGRPRLARQAARRQGGAADDDHDDDDDRAAADHRAGDHHDEADDDHRGTDHHHRRAEHDLTRRWPAPVSRRLPRRRPSPGSCAAASWPSPVRMLSGWNCTPSIGSSRWRTPITTLVGGGGDLEAVGHRRRVDDQAVVAGAGQRRRQAGEHADLAVLDRRRLAVHQRRGPHDPCPERVPDRLVAEAHAEHRHAALGEGEDRRADDPGVLRAAGPGREQHRVRSAGRAPRPRSTRRCGARPARRRARRGTARGCRRSCRSCR